MDAEVVLVDARNVLRSTWPNLGEDEVVDCCRRFAAQQGVLVVVAFDGPAPGGLVGEEKVDGRCTVVGTGSESADDWLARAAERHERDETPYALVTSDRELRSRAGRAAVDVVGGGSFVRTLIELPD
jgi:predicted RNA-binding protein with PIN domain